MYRTELVRNQTIYLDEVDRFNCNVTTMWLLRNNYDTKISLTKRLSYRASWIITPIRLIHWPWSLMRGNRRRCSWGWRLRSPSNFRWRPVQCGRSSTCKLTLQRMSSSRPRSYHPLKQVCVFAVVALGLALVPHRSHHCWIPETGMSRPWLGCWAQIRSPGVQRAEVAPRQITPNPAAACEPNPNPPEPLDAGRRPFVVATDLKNTRNSFNFIPVFWVQNVSSIVLKRIYSWEKLCCFLQRFG